MGALRIPRAPRGFTLIEILVVVVIIGLILAMTAALVRSFAATQKRSITTSRLSAIDAALVQYVMLNKRLPCPADGTQDSSSGGLETPRPCPSQQNGVVPWRTLGLSAADAMDGWDRRFTYRVSPSLAADDGMNMAMCDPAGTEPPSPGGPCNPTCTPSALGTCTAPGNFLANKGIVVQNLAGTDLMPAPNRAAYILISHGESGGGAYLSTGQLSTSASTDGTEEQKNYANLALQGYYVDDQTSDVAGPSHFDDIVSRPTILNVANKAGLGPRAH